MTKKVKFQYHKKGINKIDKKIAMLPLPLMNIKKEPNGKYK